MAIGFVQIVIFKIFNFLSQLYSLQETLNEFIKDKKNKGEGVMFARELLKNIRQR